MIQKLAENSDTAMSGRKPVKMKIGQIPSKEKRILMAFVNFNYLYVNCVSVSFLGND